MREATKILSALGSVFLLSGCPIWLETNNVRDRRPDNYSYEPCGTDGDCSPGYFCSSRGCEVSGFCDWDGWCPPGQVCDDRDTCVPVAGLACNDHEDCLNGYCAIEEGQQVGACVVTGTCSSEEDCAVYAPGLTCDDRQVCVPDDGPCPAGQCGCLVDGDCGMGNFCVNSRCIDMNAVCIFDYECGPTGSCVNSECHQGCTGENECPTGQECRNGFCGDLAAGTGECAYNEDCAATGFRCLNSTCHVACTETSECGAGESCLRGACQADERPIWTCQAATDCAPDLGCIRGQCRLPCASSLNCQNEAGMTACLGGFCRYPYEIDLECQRETDCGQSTPDCVNGACLSLE